MVFGEKIASLEIRLHRARWNSVRESGPPASEHALQF